MKKILKNNEENTISPEVKEVLKQNDIDQTDKESVMRMAIFGDLSKQLIIKVGWEEEYLEYKNIFLNKILKQLLRK